MRSLIAIFIACALVSTTVPSNAAGRLAGTEHGPPAAWTKGEGEWVASTAWAGATIAWARATTAVASAATAVATAATAWATWVVVTEQKKSAPDKAGSEPVQNKRTTIPD